MASIIRQTIYDYTTCSGANLGNMPAFPNNQIPARLDPFAKNFIALSP